MLRYIKLHGGDELIGEAADDSQEFDVKIELKHPWRMVPTPKGYATLPIPAKSLTVDTVCVLALGEVDADLEAAYMEHYGRLVRPPQDLVIPH